MILRIEQEKDYFEVENLTREAFWNVYRPGCCEHLILHRLRNDPRFVPELDYVVEEEGKLIAAIAYARGFLTLEDGGETDLLLFGPVSVLPEYQGRGYGEKIIRFTLEQARRLGYPAVVITGSPQYYGKFGFESASRQGIYYKGTDRGEESPFFLIKILEPNGAAALKGTYSDPECYLTNEKDVDAFDQQFPPKEKEVRPGQLS